MSRPDTTPLLCLPNDKAAPKAAKPQPLTPLLTVANTAEILRVCTKTVRRMIDDQKLPSVRVGRGVRIAEADLRTYLLAGRR